MPKSKRMRGTRVERKRPLDVQIRNEELYAKQKRKKKTKPEETEVTRPKYIEGKPAQKIISVSLAQREELNINDSRDWLSLDSNKEWPSLLDSNTKQNLAKAPPEWHKSIKSKDHFKQMQLEAANSEILTKTKKVKLSEEEKEKLFSNKLKSLDDDDYSILSHFKEKSDAGHKLSQVFRDKITEKQTELQSQIDMQSNADITIDPKLRQICRDIGDVLASFRSGPLPKMFKVFPTMNIWEDLLRLTEPDQWTAAAVKEGTRLFVSSLQEPMAQRFMNMVLLPRLRDHVREDKTKNLNVYMFEALMRATKKPAAFFKGVLLPLCMSKCTVTEAILVSAVLRRSKFPVVTVAAAIGKLLSIDYSGPNCIILRTFFMKKYALPFQIIDDVVDFFVSFEAFRRDVVVAWHRALLAFVMYYRDFISEEQKDGILALLKAQYHYQVTPAIRKELSLAKPNEYVEPMRTGETMEGMESSVPDTSCDALENDTGVEGDWSDIDVMSDVEDEDMDDEGSVASN